MSNKTRLRQEIAEKRRSLNRRWLEESSRHIVERILALDAFKTSRTVALYKAIGGEADLESLFSACWNAGKETSIPVFNRELNAYEMAMVGPETRYLTGNYGIQEPEIPNLVGLDKIDLILVPGVAFDPKGNRLGRGGGYYDRLLNGFKGATVAVAFDFQIFPLIPHDTHDVPVERVVTESKVVDVCNER